MTSKTTNKFVPEFREGATDGFRSRAGSHVQMGGRSIDYQEDRLRSQTLHDWVKKAEVDSGKRDGVPTEMADKVRR